MSVVKVLVNGNWTVMSTRPMSPEKINEICRQLREINIPAKPALA